MSKTSEVAAERMIAGAQETCLEIAADYNVVKKNFAEALNTKGSVTGVQLDQLARYVVAMNLVRDLDRIICLRQEMKATSALAVESILDYYTERLVLASVVTNDPHSPNSAYMVQFNVVWLQNIVGYFRGYTNYLVMF